MSVSITPGFKGTAAMPFGSSWARASVNPSTAYFDAQYGATSGAVLRPQPLDRFTITPVFRFTMTGTNARIRFATPLTLTSIRWSNASAGTFQSGAGVVITAALLIRRPGGPNRARTASAHAVTAAASRTSTTENSDRSAYPARDRAMSSTCDFDRPHPATV